MSSVIDKLLGIATVGSTLANVSFLQRLVLDVTKLLALTVITACMATALLIGGFCVAYLGFVHYGLEPVIAAATVITFMLLVTLVLVAFTTSRLRQLRTIHFDTIPRDIPGLSRLVGIGEAFLDGLLGGHKKP